MAYTHNYDKNSNHLRFETQHNKNLGANNMIIDPDSDQLFQVNVTKNRQIRLTYDAEGNMRTKTRYVGATPVETTQYGYNYQGQLQAVTKNNQAIASYGYHQVG